VSSIVRYNLNPIIFVLNNHGYTIEEEIHKGQYNQIKNWNYSELVNIFNAKDNDESFGIGRGHKILKNAELDKAITHALTYKDGPSIIEVIIDKDDCNKELEHWGKCVSASNSRPPALPFSQPQTY
jgi:pyruvate decarboxylase